MKVKLNIELDEMVAHSLQGRAVELGVSIGDLIAELAKSTRLANTEEIAELDRRWAKVAAGVPTVAHGAIVRWLADWGSTK